MEVVIASSARAQPDPFFTLSPDMLCVVGRDGRARRLNPRWREVLGFTEDELTSRPLLDWVHPDERASVSLSSAFECRFACRDGSYRRLAWTVAWAPQEGAFYCVVRDVTERRCIEEALRRAEARLRTVVDHASIILFAFDREGRFTFADGRGLAALGLKPGESLGRSVFEMYADSPSILDAACRALSGETVTANVDLPAAGRSYETRYTPVFGSGGDVVEVIGAATDITARRQAEAALERSTAQLVEADRLASLGTLAAGVAHEINNPLSYVLLNLDLTLRDLSADPPPAARLAEAASRLGEARSGIERVRHIVQDLKAFSRVSAELRAPVDVRRVLDATLELASAELRHRAHLTRAFDDVPLVLADASRLGQVFLNLIVNAVQAMAERDPVDSEIRVRTRTDAAGRAVVEISDTGAGMAPDVAARIFEPFFTTKPAGVGTGLGLSICHGIVMSLGGDITVESEPGRGSTFRVALPPAPAGAVESARPPVEPRAAPKAVAPRGRVLVIDDEPALANALGKSLAHAFEVTSLSSGRDALLRLRAGETFDAIVCDLIMPGVTGMDLHEELQRSRPELAERMIFMSGGTFTSRARAFLATVPNPALDKPFELSLLEAMLRARVAS